MGLSKKLEEKRAVQAKSQTSVQPGYQALWEESIEFDALERLKANIHMLDDLQSRLGYLNSELEDLLGSRKKNHKN